MQLILYAHFRNREAVAASQNGLPVAGKCTKKSGLSTSAVSKSGSSSPASAHRHASRAVRVRPSGRPHSLRRRFPYRNRHGLHKATRSTGRLPDFPEFPSRKSAGNPRHCCGFRRRSRPAPRKREPEHRAAKRSAAGRTPSFRSARKQAAGPGRKRRKSGRNRTPAPCKPTAATAAAETSGPS